MHVHVARLLPLPLPLRPFATDLEQQSRLFNTSLCALNRVRGDHRPPACSMLSSLRLDPREYVACLSHRGLREYVACLDRRDSGESGHRASVEQQDLLGLKEQGPDSSLTQSSVPLWRRPQRLLHQERHQSPWTESIRFLFTENRSLDNNEILLRVSVHLLKIVTVH